eukprot:3731546-Rhodomonas_salina.1
MPDSPVVHAWRPPLTRSMMPCCPKRAVRCHAHGPDMQPAPASTTHTKSELSPSHPKRQPKIGISTPG